MDKRTIIFIVCVSAAFFMANLYFTQQRQEQEKEWRDYQKLKTERIELEKSSSIESRTKSAEDLPLVEIYADDAQSHFLSTGVLDNGVVLTIGWDHALPNTIYARPYKTTGDLTTFKINSDEKMDEISLKGQPVVFSEDGKKPLDFADVPLFGSYDLQLVTLYGKDARSPFEIGLGEINDGAFESFRSQTDMETPPAIALYDVNGKYYPVGVIAGAKEHFFDLEEFDTLRHNIEKIESKATVPVATQIETNERYFVLENEYQQLVFSNVGGSLVEINLPFTDGKNPLSVVKPIQADRDMVKFDPKNAQFPLEQSVGYDGKIVESKEDSYYPLIRRNYYAPKTFKERKVEPQYQALNIVSEYPELAQLVYEVKEFTSDKIVFEATQRQRKITKTFTLAKESAAPYVFNLDVKIDGDSRGLWLTSGLLEAESVAGAIAPSMKYRMMKKGQGVVESIDLPTDSTVTASINPTWIVNSNGFFGIILDPQTEIGPGWRTQKVPGSTVYSRLVALEEEHPEWNPQDLPSYMMMLPLSNNKTASFRVFAGPFANNVLKTVDKTFPDSDYISTQTFHGWFAFISEPFAKFLFIIMDFFHSVTGSWALSIVLLTIVLRILLYPLNAWSTKSMISMQRISPKVQAIQEKYKNDKQKAQMEIMELYRKEKVNPFSGCLPLLIQMPFLIGMFDLLKSTFALRGASFIPGWIDDLSAPDVLFSWNFNIPFLGSEFHLLPILLGLVMFFQSRMNMPVMDPAKMTDQQKQQKASGTIMAILFTVLFYKFPSGLNIYWLSSMLLGILQQWWTQKKMKIQNIKA